MLHKPTATDDKGLYGYSHYFCLQLIQTESEQLHYFDNIQLYLLDKTELPWVWTVDHQNLQ